MMVNKRAIILLALVVVIIAFPLAYYNGKGDSQSYFGGTDDQGSAYISSKGYQPWFNSIWTPSPEIESLLFTIQAAIGALVIGYVIGYYKGKTKPRKNDKLDNNQTKN